ncbi:MAG TPA: PASTA domain-containing protein, partial [Phototrophicaceae bacterium]|nr:PASTA domain-containing protein [Phototrophicaceae bacterium]
MKIRLSIILILLSFAYLVTGSIQSLAQTSEVVVPDLTGLNVPQAAAALNRVGLALGTESAGLWTSNSGIPENTIGSQSVTPGGSAAPGTSVDVILLRSPNITLIYDDNDLTMMNRDNRRVDFTSLVFNTLESATSASFNASRWSGRLRGGYCTQLWSVGRGNAKDVDGCKGIDNWLTTNNPAEHFWTASNGVKNFSVVQDGVERAICEAASSEPKTCDFYLETAGQSDSAEFVYFAYSADRLI